MDWITQICNNDSVIKNIVFDDDDVVVTIEFWNGEDKKLTFKNYWAIKEKNSIGKTIGDIFVNTNSILLSELEDDILKGDGSQEEIRNIKSIVFMDVWEPEIMLLEILADSVELN